MRVLRSKCLRSTPPADTEDVHFFKALKALHCAETSCTRAEAKSKLCKELFLGPMYTGFTVGLFFEDISFVPFEF